MPVYAGPIEVDAIAPGRERSAPSLAPAPERRTPSLAPARERPVLASEGRLTRFLRALWTEEPDEIELRARRAARLARERAA